MNIIIILSNKMEIEDDDLERMKLYGLEPMPRLDDIPELKRILTPGVLIRLKEKYEVPFGKKYKLNDIALSKYKVVYAENKLQNYKCIFVFNSRPYIGVYQIYLRDLAYTFNSTHCYWGDDCHITKINEYNIIPLIVNKKPLSDKEKELIIRDVEKRRDSYLELFS